MTQENPGLVFLERVRLSFVHLAAPQAVEGGMPKYNADFIMEPAHPGYAAFMAQAQAMALEKWNAQADAILQYITANRKFRCYGPGEECVDQKTMQPYVGYPGNVHISANNDIQPVMFDANGTQLMDARKFYGGCYVNVQLKPWPQDNTHGRAVRCELVGVQFHSDGEAFGVAPIDATTLFGAIPGAPAAIAAGVVPGGVYQVPPQNLPGAVQPLGVPGIPGVPAPIAAPVYAAPPAQVGVAPVGYPPASAQVAPVVAAPLAPPITAPPVQTVGVAPPGGYDPALYPAPVAPGYPAQGAPAQYVQPPGVNPATGMPY